MYNIHKKMMYICIISQYTYTQNRCILCLQAKEIQKLVRERSFRSRYWFFCMQPPTCKTVSKNPKKGLTNPDKRVIIALKIRARPFTRPNPYLYIAQQGHGNCGFPFAHIVQSKFFTVLRF